MSPALLLSFVVGYFVLCSTLKKLSKIPEKLPMKRPWLNEESGPRMRRRGAEVVTSVSGGSCRTASWSAWRVSWKKKERWITFSVFLIKILSIVWKNATSLPKQIVTNSDGLRKHCWKSIFQRGGRRNKNPRCSDESTIARDLSLNIQFFEANITNNSIL